MRDEREMREREMRERDREKELLYIILVQVY